MDLKGVIEWIKLRPRHLIGLGVTCLVVVGLPQRWRSYLQYDHIIASITGWVSLVGLASLLYGLVLLVADYAPKLKDSWNGWRRRRRRPRILRGLSPDEKERLAMYIKQDVTTLRFPLGDGLANALESKGVLYRASTMSVEDDEFAFNVQPWVTRVINERRDIRQDILKHAAAGARIRAGL